MKRRLNFWRRRLKRAEDAGKSLGKESQIQEERHAEATEGNEGPESIGPRLSMEDDSTSGIAFPLSTDSHSMSSAPRNDLAIDRPDSQYVSVMSTGGYGLHILAEARNPSVDIIFVHGLGGHAKETWTFRDKTTREPSCCWPQDLLPTDLPSTRIMTFGYDSTPYFSGYSTQGVLESHSSRLLAELTDCRSKSMAIKRPLIFVAHSLGGLIVKNALVQSSMAVSKPAKEATAVKRSTVGLVFYHARGHNNQERPCSGVLDDMIPLGWNKNSSLETLEEKLQLLELQVDEFKSIQHNFRRFTIYLTQPADTFLLQTSDQRHLVDLNQTNPVTKETYLNVVRTVHEDYRTAIELLKNICDKAPGLCTENWAQEPAASRIPKGFSVLRRTSTVNDELRIHIMLNRNEDELFVGRDKEIAQLDVLLTKENKVLLVHGPSGVGKSMLVSHYIRAHEEDFPLILWVDARSAGSIRSSYVHLAQRLIDYYRTFYEQYKVPKLLAAEYLGMTNIVDDKGQLLADAELQASIMKAVQDWLCRSQAKDGLLIFDHVDELEHSDNQENYSGRLDIEVFFPESFLGRIIIISQHDDYLFPCRKLQLGPLEEADAVKLLDSCVSVKLWLDHFVPINIVVSVAKLVHYFPQAIIDAGAYMSLPGDRGSLADLIRNRLRTYQSIMPSTPRQPDFLQDLKKLSLDLTGSEHEYYMNSGLEYMDSLGIELLRRGSLFANADIPIRLLNSGYNGFASVDRAVEALIERGFLERKEDPTVVRLNRGIYLWQQSRAQDETLLSAALVNFARGLKMEFQSFQHGLKSSTSMWVFEQYALPHIIASLKWVERVPLEYKPKFEILGQICEHQGRYGEAERFLKLASLREDRLGQDLQDCARLSIYLGRIYHLQSRYKEAEQIYKSTPLIKVDQYRKYYHLGSQLLEGLASIYKVTGRTSEATELYKLMLAKRHGDSMKTGDDSNTLRLLDMLAMNYQKQGKDEEAKMIYQRILVSRIELHGNDGALTTKTKRRLAITMQRMGDYGEAEVLFRQLLDSSKERLERNHSTVLGDIASLAVLCDLQSRWVKAEDLYREAFTGREAVLGRYHPDTLDIAENFALSFQLQGRLDKAAELYSDVLTRREQTRNHSKTMKTAVRLAEVYGKLGEKDKIEQLHKYWKISAEGGTESSRLPLTKTSDL